MKTNFLPSTLKLSVALFFFAFLGFQQAANAQLWVKNGTNCWIVVGEEEGLTCNNFCNSPVGTWIAPGTSQQFTATCGLSGGQEHWIGLKWAVGTPFPMPTAGNASFSDNPNYPGGPCGYQVDVNVCGGSLLVPFWQLLAPNGSSVVYFL